MLLIILLSADYDENYDADVELSMTVLLLIVLITRLKTWTTRFALKAD